MWDPCRPLRLAGPALVLAVAALAPPAAAGPWERAAGRAFVSGTLGIETAAGASRASAEAYAEAGLGRRLVPSLKLRAARPPGGGRTAGEADLRLRWHPASGGAMALGIELGIRGETRAGPDAGGGFGVAALHLGRGFATPAGAGWTRLSLTAQEPLGSRDRPRREGMAQVGLRAGDGWLGLVSLSVFDRAGDTTVKLMPALGRQLAPGRDLLLELTVERGGASTRGLGLSLWQEF